MSENHATLDAMQDDRTGDARFGKYLTFHMCDENYGIDILKVVEIIAMLDITDIPRLPGFIRGVINLRGKIIPVIDLRSLFRLPAIEYHERTCIIIVQIPRKEQLVTAGIIVDEVSEVVDFEADHIEDTPAFGASVDTQFLLGMGKYMDKVYLLLDVDKALESDELGVVESLSQSF